MNPRAATGMSAAVPNLDALRALAVLLVLADHVLETIGHTAGIKFHPYDWYLGRLGVLLFFVHTAYVLNASMDRLGTSGTTLLRSFYIRRAFRIYPLALFCIVLVVACQIPPLPWDQFSPPGAGELLSNALLTTNLTLTPPVLSPMWSLPVEVQMYVLLPFIFLLSNRATDLRKLALMYAGALIVAWFLPQLSSRQSGAIFAPCFMAGIIAFALRDRVAPRIPAVLWPLFLLAAIAVYISVEHATEGIHHYALQSFICLAVGLAIPVFHQSTQALFNRVMHEIAKYSYGIYLFHCVGLWAGYFWMQTESAALRAATALALMVALSVAAYHLLEAPAIRLGARMAAVRAARQVAAT